MYVVPGDIGNIRSEPGIELSDGWMIKGRKEKWKNLKYKK